MGQRVALMMVGVGLSWLAGCATSEQSEPDMAAQMIARMDAAPEAERVPHWDVVRARMVREAPSVGDAAPMFTLPRMDGGGSISLAEFQPTKPVVLIFGSWT